MRSGLEANKVDKISRLWTQKRARVVSSSKAHTRFSSLLDSLDIPHLNEVQGVDMLVMHATKGSVPVQIYGPTHYLSDGRVNGQTLVMERLVQEQFNQTVVSVSAKECDQLDAQARFQQEKFLKGKGLL